MSPHATPEVRGPGFTYAAEWPWVTVSAARVDWHKRSPLRFVQAREMERRVMAAAARHPDLSTADRLVLVGLVSLTIGYLSPVNRLTWVQVERLTGMQAKNLTRHVDTLARHGFVTVASAQGRGRSLVQVHNQPDDNTLTLFDALQFDAPDEPDIAVDATPPDDPLFPQPEEITAMAPPDLSPHPEETTNPYLLTMRKYHPSAPEVSPHPEEIRTSLFPQGEEIRKKLFPQGEDSDSSGGGNNTLTKGSKKGSNYVREVGGREGGSVALSRHSAQPGTATPPKNPPATDPHDRTSPVLAAVHALHPVADADILETTAPPETAASARQLAIWCVDVLQASLRANRAECSDEQPPLTPSQHKSVTAAVVALLTADPPSAWPDVLRGLGYWAEEGYRSATQFADYVGRVREACAVGIDPAPVTVRDHVHLGANLHGDPLMWRPRARD